MTDRLAKSRLHLSGLVAIGLAAVLSSGGCQRLQPAPFYPPPPSGASAATAAPASDAAPVRRAAIEAAAAPGGAEHDQATSQVRRPPLATQPAAAQGSEPTVVRGQGGGSFAIPPTFQLSADGGRHSREPLPVSGQPATPTMQSPAAAQSPAVAAGTSSQPAARSAPAAQVAERPPGVAPAQYTSPPGYLPPAAGPSTTAPSRYPQTAYPQTPHLQPGYAQPGYAQPGYAQPGYAPQQTYPAQPGMAAPQGVSPYTGQPGYDVLPEIAGEDLGPGISLGEPLPYTPLTRTADIIVNGYPARTGRIMFGGAVNSDAGVTGQVTIEERNFDITRFPRSFQDLVGGTAFRGAGQTFRVEAVPGSRFKRYSVNFTEPYIFGYMPISMSVSGFLFDRRYQDWDEERLGGRLSFGYRITPDLSISAGFRGETVDITNPRVAGVPQLDSVLGENELYSGQLQLTHDTRNSPFAPSEGHYLEMSFEQAFGDFEYPRGEIALSKYFLVRERADGSGKQTLTTAWSLGFSGEDTPIFENYYAGGYSTLRGFEFRGASPTVNGVQVGGRFKFLGTVEYMFPLTADDMLRGVAFVDYGTVEQDVEINSENFRVAPGVGLRVAVPALGPAPLAFDFAFPIEEAATDEKQTFSFYMGLNRRF